MTNALLLAGSGYQSTGEECETGLEAFKEGCEVAANNIIRVFPHKQYRLSVGGDEQVGKVQYELELSLDADNEVRYALYSADDPYRAVDRTSVIGVYEHRSRYPLSGGYTIHIMNPGGEVAEVCITIIQCTEEIQMIEPGSE